MMCEGISPRIWMRYSPRSVSIGVTVGGEVRVEADFLRHHGLSLGDRLGAGLAADGEHDVARLLGGQRKMHFSAGRLHAPLVGLEIEVEVRKRVVLDVARGIAQRLEFGQALGRLAPARNEIDLDEFQRLL
jgi:hypothetical protein